MTPRRALVAVAVLTLAGCAEHEGPQSPATLGAHAEMAGGAFFKEKTEIGGQIGGGVGFETTGCCGLGLYVARTSIQRAGSDEKAADGSSIRDKQRVADITEGGGAVTIVLPGLKNWLRLRLRGGLAGEPPSLPSLGRTGYAGGATLLGRIVGREPPDVGHAAGGVDVFVGYSAWTFGRMRTPAGLEDGTYTQGGLLAGVRIVGDYGVDFQ